MGESGRVNVGKLRNAVHGAEGDFNLLNDQDLSKLQGAIDRVHAKMQSLREATAEALKTTEQELQDLEAQGNRLREEQLRYERQTSEVEAQLREARDLGEKQAIKNIEDRLKLLNTIHAKRMGQINAEQEAEKRAELARAAEAQASRTARDTSRSSRSREQVAVMPARERRVMLDFRGPDGRVAGSGQFGEREAVSVEKMLREVAASKSTSSFR
jgi:chromosome segregation ATPase